ncbi:hypothetical protein BJ684DRAFT_16673 [Piptocephalis cylindrospora]|uniref:C2 domain-containing protein n=1 Tax=Piptocephalis cylindrospora TaxID=1907219 RepID=A0A4V1IY06_9FUNG|nr:hypothetical protein BJ684DRAFT_16673 [Piptocephalis cylindrospora]|eukprot:RKP12889.1 hypothetical protein BJ684DRAFT_16673 [Piptocephalis cylindrospora]
MSKELFLVLECHDGRGFLPRHPSYRLTLHAQLLDASLETDPVLPTTCPIFHSDLAFTLSRDRLVKLRTSRASIRVQVPLPPPYPRRWTSLGYLLVPTRAASPSNPPRVWYSVLGLPQEYKQAGAHPQVRLSLSLDTPPDPPSPVLAPRYSDLDHGVPKDQSITTQGTGARERSAIRSSIQTSSLP